MAAKTAKREYEGLSVPELTDAERVEYIDRLESERDDVIFELEQLMRRSAKLLRRRSLARRKYKLGSSPNDRPV